MDKIPKSSHTYQGLVEQISKRYEQGRQQAVIAVNSHLINTYWNVGRDIVEFEQNGQGYIRLPSAGKSVERLVNQAWERF